jgi:hypothetical protein
MDRPVKPAMTCKSCVVSGFQQLMTQQHQLEFSKFPVIGWLRYGFHEITRLFQWFDRNSLFLWKTGNFWSGTGNHSSDLRISSPVHMIQQVVLTTILYKIRVPQQSYFVDPVSPVASVSSEG